MLLDWRDFIMKIIFFNAVVAAQQFINLALRKTTWQSSTYHFGSDSYRAVDGNNDTDWNHSSCSQTAGNETSPWFAVDLGALANVYSVKLTNRFDKHGMRQNFT
jgi:hypothetical protein